MQTASQTLVFRDFLPLLLENPEYVEATYFRIMRAASRSAQSQIERSARPECEPDNINSALRRAMMGCDQRYAYLPISPMDENPLSLLLLICERAELDAKRLGGTASSRRRDILVSLNLENILNFDNVAAVETFRKACQTPGFDGLCGIDNWYLLACAIIYGLNLPESTMNDVCIRAVSLGLRRRSSPPSPYVSHSILDDGHVSLPFVTVRLETYAQKVERLNKSR